MPKDTYYYDILNIDVDSSKDDILNSYKTLIKNAYNENNVEKIDNITAAYEILYNTEYRQEYNRLGKEEYVINFTNPQKIYNLIFNEDVEDVEDVEEVEDEEDVEEDENDGENNGEDEEDDKLEVYVPISLDDSYFGNTKQISFKRKLYNTKKSETINIELIIPKGAMIGEYQILNDRGNQTSDNTFGTVIFIYVDEEESSEQSDDDEESSKEEPSDDDEESSKEEPSDNEEELSKEEPSDESSVESSFEPSDTSPKNKKYQFIRGENNNLEITIEISLKEYYIGVERSIDYFGDKKLHLVYPFKIDLMNEYILSGYGINGKDLVVKFDLIMPDEIPKENEKEFCGLMDKVCKKYNETKFNELEAEDINILVKKEYVEENESDTDMQHNSGFPQCSQQ